MALLNLDNLAGRKAWYDPPPGAPVPRDFVTPRVVRAELRRQIADDRVDFGVQFDLEAKVFYVDVFEVATGRVLRTEEELRAVIERPDWHEAPFGIVLKTAES